jgi:hypothetical protein
MEVVTDMEAVVTDMEAAQVQKLRSFASTKRD